MLTQTEIEEIVNECRADLKAINIDVPIIPVSTMKSTRYWGICRSKRDPYTKKISSEIRLNKVLCDGEANHAIPLKNTIVHELLHAALPFEKHGTAWKNLANKVNQKYSEYNIERQNDYSEYGLDIRRKLKDEDLYIIQCESCGRQVTRQRYSKLIANLSKYGCGKCDGDLKLIQTPKGVDILSVHHNHPQHVKITI